MEKQVKIKILLIEDDEDDYIITKDVIDDFPQHNYHLTWIKTYNEGLAEVLKNEHDVYLIDYRLGANSGLDIVRHANEKGINKPFIMLTGQQDHEIDEEARRAGAIDYLIKGRIDTYQLERSIRYGIQNVNNLKKIQLLNEELESRVEARTKDLALSNEALRESQLLYTSIASNFPDGMIQVLDKTLKFLFVDGTDFQLFGIPKGKIIGKQLHEVLSDPELSSVRESFGLALSGERVSFELSNSKGDQTYEATALPLREEKGHINQIMIVFRNITQKKIAEFEIKNALEKEKQLGEMKSRFVTTASHEFRTPLSTILSSISLIDRYNKAEPVENQNISKHINRIKWSVNNLNQILTDFLSAGQLEEGKISYQPAYFDFEEMVNGTLQGLKILLKPNQNVDFQNSCTNNQYCLDEQILRNILINLLSNAIKYSPENSTIVLKSDCKNEELIIHVIDQGIGIPEKDIENIFERFFRANNAINIQGTGLGLNIVKRYVELMAGDINFTSKEGSGTEFKVTIPINVNE
jgi:PAS domain S-box-containing protein